MRFIDLTVVVREKIMAYWSYAPRVLSRSTLQTQLCDCLRNPIT